jgi:hypothetical protein
MSVAAFALRKELADKDILLSQLRDLCSDDPQLLADSIQGETELNELIDTVVTNVREKDLIIDGIAATLKKLRDRKSMAEKQKETLVTLLAVTLDRMGVKHHLCGDGTKLTLSATGPVAKVVEEMDVPTKWLIKQPDKIDQDGLTKYVRARIKAVKEAEKITDYETRSRRLSEIAREFPPIPGVMESNGGFSLRGI